eukprot:gene11069-3775_t
MNAPYDPKEKKNCKRNEFIAKIQRSRECSDPFSRLNSWHEKLIIKITHLQDSLKVAEEENSRLRKELNVLKLESTNDHSDYVSYCFIKHNETFYASENNKTKEFELKFAAMEENHQKEINDMYKTIRNLQTKLQISFAKTTLLKEEIQALKEKKGICSPVKLSNEIQSPRYQVKDAMIEFIACILLMMVFASIIVIFIAKLMGVYRMIV